MVMDPVFIYLKKELFIVKGSYILFYKELLMLMEEHYYNLTVKPLILNLELLHFFLREFIVQFLWKEIKQRNFLLVGLRIKLIHLYTISEKTSLIQPYYMTVCNIFL
jgi:hypothetical protein